MAEANKSYAVYGNSGLQTATLIPDLTQAVDSNFLKIEQNVASLNCWQPIFTSDLISENFRQEEYPTSISGDFAQNTEAIVTWEFYLKGWTQLKQIILQYVLGLACNTDPQNTAEGLGYGMALPSCQEQPEYTWLDVLENIDIRIGNNSFSLTKQELHNRYGIKHLALSTKKTHAEACVMANFGLQAAKTSGLIYYQNSFSTLPQPYLAVPTEYSNANKYNYHSVDAYAKYYDHAFTNLAQFDIKGKGTSTGFYYQPKYFSLPICMINSFFAQENTWLPKGLKIAIQVTFANRKKVYAGGMFMPTFSNTTTQTEAQTTKLIINGFATGSLNGFFKNQIKIVYEYSRLKYELGEDLKKMWLERPFLYNYYEWDVYTTVILKANQSTPYIIDFKQNAQRPLDIWIAIRKDEETTYIDRKLNVNGKSLRFNLPAFGLCPVIYQSIKVFINGTEQTYIQSPRLQSDLNQTIADGLTGDDVLNSLIYNKCDKENNLDMATQPLSRQINYDNIYPYQITIAPSNFFQRGTYPVDKGAVNVRLEITPVFLTETGVPLLSNWINYANAKLFVYSRRGAQLTLDASHNCTSVEWPLVVSNNTTVATPTINTN